MRLILAQPRGFCAGVKRAIDIVEIAIRDYGDKFKIYILHEIVHNRHIVEDLTKRGVFFVKSVQDVPSGSILIFSAHGVAKKIEEDALARNLHVIDATCPLVSKVHKEAQRHEHHGLQVILIGHEGHPEVAGTSGRINKKVLLVQTIEDIDNLKVDDPDKLSYVTQTTLSLDDTRAIVIALKKKYPNIVGPDLRDICYATQNRQNAVRKLSSEVDLFLIIGSKNSSNSNRLLDLCRAQGVRSFLINSYRDVDLNWFDKVNIVGISAGASAPEVLIDELISYLKSQIVDVKLSIMEGIAENIKFKLPKNLDSKENSAHVLVSLD